MVVELENGVWIAEGEGDPPRTIIPENARRFPNITEACKALIEARKYRPFPNATISSGWVNEAKAEKRSQ
jgi:hypothetical protein